MGKINSPFFDELPTEGYDECVICGCDSYGYAFCKDCYSRYENEDLADILEFQECKEITTECLICKEESYGYHFCRDCYTKYKNKRLILSVTGCQNIEILKDDYPTTHRCTDGHWVRSKAEREIDDYLFSHNIPHIYEKPVYYDKNKEDIIHPDFCLPNYLGQGKDVYIEHWGSDDPEYKKQQIFKLIIYKKMKFTVVCIYEGVDTQDIQATLNRKLNKAFIVLGKINFIEKNLPKSSRRKNATNDDDDIPF